MAKKNKHDAQNTARLFEKYERMMYQAAFRQVNNQEDAEDAVIEAFLSMIKAGRLPSADDPLAAPVLITTAKYKAIDIFTKRISTEHVPEDVLLEKASFVQVSDISLDLESAVSNLPDHLREALVLNVYYGFSTLEIAEMQGVKRDTVQKRIKRARKLLKESLREDS